MMAAEEEPDALQIYWERFFKAETGTYEKSTWLELFLAEFIIRLNEGQNPKKLINFCPVSGVVSLVGCELLCGIHRVTSSINTHYSLSSIEPVTVPNDVTDHAEVPRPEARGPLSAFSRMQAQPASTVLRAYLLAGLAWRCLVLLRALGVEGLSCCRQLSSVLIWVYGETCTGPTSAYATSGVKPRVPLALRPGQRPPIHQLFSNRIWSKQKSCNGPNHSAASSEKSYISRRSRMNGRPRSETNGRSKRSIKNSEVSSDSGDSNDDLQIFNRSMAIKVCTTNDDFEYFNSPFRSSDDYLNHSLYSDPFYSPRKAKPKADDYMTDKHREIINSEISTFEFTLLITDLLQELCKAESSLSGSEGSQISMQCINFALKNLCSLQFGSVPNAANNDALETSSVKVALTELLMVSLDQVLIHADLCAKLINNGILPMLLRLLEDVVCKSSVKYNAKTEKGAKECANQEETENLLKFVFGIAYSITAFLHCLLMQCRSLEKLREFTEQFALYAECHKGGLLRECVELVLDAAPPSAPALALVHALVDAAARLVRALQRVRGAVLHAAACPRALHRACRARVAAGRRHHHDALGARAACAVAVLCAALAALLARAPAGARVLRALLRCGLCCCFPRALLAQAVVRAVLARAVPAAAGLRLLERAAFGEPRAPHRLPCAVCEVRADERRGRCAFLVHYNSLLQLDNPNSVLHATVAHLLRVTPRCRPEMKYELLFSVIYPTFIVAKHRYAMRSEESAHFLTASCLNIISSLLSTVSFAEQFIQKGGLSYVLELISMPDFSNQCCAILEVAIIVEILKLIKENEEFPYFREVGSLSSVQILFKSLSDATEKCFEVYKTKLAPEKFEELCNIDKEKQILGIPTEAPATGRFASEMESDATDEQEAVRNASTFWRCCARLCLHSPLLREHAARQHVFLRGYALLRLLLYCACHTTTVPAVSNTVPEVSNMVPEMSNTVSQMSNIMPEVSSTVPKVSNVSTTNSTPGRAVSTAGPVVSTAGPDAKVVLKIVEALLTVQFAVSDETRGRSKDTSCAIVRSALSAHTSVHGGLRALCDTLVGVALAAPSAGPALPTLAPLNVRVPPLYCGSESSSPECSSSEDSAAPYASEHSDPRPDDGYEADIEISKLDITTSLKSQKLSESLSILDNVTYSQAQGALDTEHGKDALMAHPELCVIVVDILSQLIEKVVSAGEGSRQAAEVGRVCAGLARAWAARAPRLLARLLAPAAPAARLLAAPCATELQRHVLELVAALGARGLEADEARALLRLLAAERPPLALLLPVLARVLAREPAGHAPDCALRYPVRADPEDFVTDEPTASSFAQQAEQAARRLRYSHTRAGISSPWSHGAVRAALGSAGWAPWLQGFAVAMWLKRDPPQCGTQSVHRHNEDIDETEEWHDDPPDPDDNINRESTKKEETSNQSDFMHVFSIGHESLMFELWIDTSNGALSARLARPEAGANRRVACARARTRAPRAWACLALNVAERVHKRRIHIQVTLYINGRECETLSLPVQGILVRKATPSSVLLGHAEGTSGNGNTGGLQMGTVRVYRRPVLNAAAALHVAAHGPDQPCQIPCETANFPSIITPELLELDVDWDAVYEVSSQTLRELHENLLVSFFAHTPDTMNLYHQTTSVPTVFGGRAAAGAHAAPAAVRAQWAGAPRAARSRAPAPALLLLGGAELLMYMFARVVELDGSARQQAEALATALRACLGEARLRAQLLGGALQLLLPVLGSHKCRVSPHMLKVILDAAFSAPVLQCSSTGVLLQARAGAVLREPRLLLLLMQAWRCFDTDEEISWQVSYGTEENGFSYKDKVSGGCDSTWVVALAALRVALGGAYRTFNHYQACRVDLLRHLLLACKERFLTSERPALSTSASKELVGLVRALLGDPPLLGHLAMLCDFLLLMHQASDTFVTHSRANFYFLLTTDTPESSEFNFLDFISKRKKSLVPDNRRYYDAMEKSSSSSVSEETAPDSDRADTDCDKHIKALINMQIKENRQKLSSTSETSDGATEKSVEEASEDLYEDADYILLEPPPSANDVYSASAHQGQVRAGAEPGWQACEGLLLLLRDAIVALPEHALEQAVATAIQAESLVVLANHGDAGVRAAVVRAAAALQRRRAAALSPLCGLLLANQVAAPPASWALAAACAALLTARDVPLEDQLDEEIWAGLDDDATQRCAPLLALLPGCARASSVPLAHNLAALLRRLLHKASLRALNEVAFVEVIVRAIRAVGMENTEFEGKDLLLEDLYDLLCKVAIKVLSGNHSTQMIIDMHNMLRYIEGEGGAGGVQRAARDAQVALYTAQIDYLEERLRTLHQNTPKTFNYFSTVLPSAERSEASEAAARLAGTLARGAAFLSARPPAAPLQPDADFFDRLLAGLLGGVSSADGGASSSRLFGGGGGGALAALLWWAASPEPGARALQPRLLRALYRAPAHALRLLAPARDPDALRKLSVYLLTMVQHVHLAAEAGAGEAAGVELAITDWARAWALAAQAELADSVRGAAVPAAAQRYLRADRQRRARHAAAPRLGAALARAAFAREALAQRATDAAMTITRRVVEAQNAERKAFLEHLRRAHSLHTAAQWQPVIDRHTHERGIFHNPRSYPAAWQLDSTEGPGRVRVRLRRAHLRVSPRHLQGPYKYKADTCSSAAPLSSVLGAGGAQLAPGEAVAYMARATRVAAEREAGGELLLTDRHLHFVPDEGAGAARWALGAVARVATRRWCLQERALELFLCCGHALLLAFADTDERTHFLNHLSRAHLPNRTEPVNLTEAMNQWRNGTITNWEYLMILNDLAGRSYNDLMQYPVFPFIIADYTSKILDLTDPASFRDLSKPMAVQNKNREQHYINTYNDLKAARREGCSPLSRQPHHYASLYSNSGGVLHYLVRLPPFTELFLNYQDNNFDMPDRTFHSLATTWRLITNDSPTDVKELIPELFYLPELFYNNEGLELGVRQCGARVDDVELPRWAPDARLFTLLHRHALEAPHVTERLPAWIDLVFGYKQTGQAAVDALNVFPACTYYGFDPQQLEDELDRTAAAAMVRTYGQAPRQLLRAPHPQRATELQPRRARSPPPPCAAVRGARWGRYAGSPECAAPAPVARRCVAGAARVQALAHPRAAAAVARNSLLLAVREGGEGAALCAVWWGQADGAVRAGAGGALLWVAAGERVSAAGAWAGAGGWGATGALGFSSGRLVALRAGARVTAHALHAHAAPIADVVVCPRASLLVSASVDGVIVLWDLNDLSYIRTLPNRDMLPVQCVAVSETLSDVASVHEPRVTRDGSNGDVTVNDVAADVDETGDDDVKEYERDAYNCKSLIRVHTVNGKFVASVRVGGAVTRVAYSAAAEGVAANCVAAALAGGGVRLYAAWDLRPVAALAPPMPLPVPLLDITYSSDSQLLFGCYADGTLVAWESLEPGTRAAPVRLVPASSLL